MCVRQEEKADNRYQETLSDLSACYEHDDSSEQTTLGIGRK